MNTTRDRLLLWLGVFGPVLFWVVVAIQDVLKPGGFDPMRHFVSHLSLGTAGWVNSVLLVVTGVAIVGFGIGLNRVGFPGGRWTGRLTALFGWALVAGGLFTIDPAFGFPPDAPASDPTWHGQLHDMAGAVAFISVTSATITAGRALRREEDQRRLRYLCFGAGILIVVLFVATTVTVAMDHAGTANQPLGGLFERLYLAAAMAWILIMSLAALRLGSTTGRQPVPSGCGRPGW